MTQTEPSRRWTASQVFNALQPYGYCCEKCSPNGGGGGGEDEDDDDDDDEDEEEEYEGENAAVLPCIYDPRYGKHYRIAHDAQGKPTSCSRTVRPEFTVSQATSSTSGTLSRAGRAGI